MRRKHLRRMLHNLMRCRRRLRLHLARVQFCCRRLSRLRVACLLRLLHRQLCFRCVPRKNVRSGLLGDAHTFGLCGLCLETVSQQQCQVHGAILCDRVRRGR